MLPFAKHIVDGALFRISIVCGTAATAAAGMVLITTMVAIAIASIVAATPICFVSCVSQCRLFKRWEMWEGTEATLFFVVTSVRNTASFWLLVVNYVCLLYRRWARRRWRRRGNSGSSRLFLRNNLRLRAEASDHCHLLWIVHASPFPRRIDVHHHPALATVAAPPLTCKASLFLFVVGGWPEVDFVTHAAAAHQGLGTSCVHCGATRGH